jgi:hypothetical protein
METIFTPSKKFYTSFMFLSFSYTGFLLEDWATQTHPIQKKNYKKYEYNQLTNPYA